MEVTGNRGPYCGGAPECGEGYGACLGGLDSDDPWMEITVFWPPGDGYQYVPYQLRIDSSGLAPGRHEGSIRAIHGCGWCVDNCMPVTLTVLDPADVDATPPARRPRLDGPYPNPFTDRFQYAITLGEPGHARVTILDVAGRRVAELLDRNLSAGTHVFSWSPDGDRLPSGPYVLRLEAAEIRSSRWVVLAR